MTPAASEAERLLRAAQKEHEAGRIDAALALALQAKGVDPDFAPARLYEGTTLITRKLDFPAGLAAIESALALAPDDPGMQYSAGWCYEFVAYRLARAGGRPLRDPDELFQIAAVHLERCIALDPEAKLREDAEGLLQSIRERF